MDICENKDKNGFMRRVRPASFTLYAVDENGRMDACNPHVAKAAKELVDNLFSQNSPSEDVKNIIISLAYENSRLEKKILDQEIEIGQLKGAKNALDNENSVLVGRYNEKNNILIEKTAVINDKKEEIEELKKYKEHFTKVSAQKIELEDKLNERDLEINKLKNQLDQKIIQSVNYVYKKDAFNNKKDAEITKIIHVMVLLVEKKEGDKYLIEKKTNIAALYLTLVDLDLLKPRNVDAFCTLWNANVLTRIKDKTRIKKLLAENRSISQLITKEPYNNSPIDSWRTRLTNEQQYSGSKTLLAAYNIKKEFKTILNNLSNI